MNELIAETRRLYFLPSQPGWCRNRGDSGTDTSEGVITPEILARSLAGEAVVTLDLVGADDRVRAVVVSFEKAADWKQVAALYQDVQETLALPAPAVSVSGKGYQVWFSLAEAVPVDQARAFLEGLHHRYLAEIPVTNLGLFPARDATRPLNLTPALLSENGKWSAFIDPTLGGMFVDEPWLEMAPNFDKQAGILAGLERIKAHEFQQALNILQTVAGLESAAAGPESDPAASVVRASRARSTLNVGCNFSDPKRFLLAVMNDPSASAGARIKAAKALLPYFEKGAPE